jgi:hypothetical protein
MFFTFPQSANGLFESGVPFPVPNRSFVLYNSDGATKSDLSFVGRIGSHRYRDDVNFGFAAG